MLSMIVMYRLILAWLSFSLPCCMSALEKPGIMLMTCGVGEECVGEEGEGGVGGVSVGQVAGAAAAGNLLASCTLHAAHLTALHNSTLRPLTQHTHTGTGTHLAHGPHLHDVCKLLVHDAQRELALADLVNQLLLRILLQRYRMIWRGPVDGGLQAYRQQFTSNCSTPAPAAAHQHWQLLLICKHSILAMPPCPH